MAEVIQTSQTASIEPVNGTILNHREMARLSDPHDWTSKGTRTRGHAHGYTPRLPPKHRPRSNAPGTWEASIWASAWLATSRPRTRLHSRAFILLTLWSFCRSWGCPSGWSGCKTAATFIACICWRDTSWANGCSSYDHRCNRRHLQDPGWQRYTLLAFCHFDNAVHPILQGDNYLFSCLSWDPKWDELSKVHIPHICIVSLTWRRQCNIYFLKVKIDCVVWPREHYFLRDPWKDSYYSKERSRSPSIYHILLPQCENFSS